MRFRIRRNHNIRPLAYREGRAAARSALDDEEWNMPAPPPATEDALSTPPSEPEMTAPLPVPPPPFANGFRAQLTGGDARTERLVRSVRLELDDLRHQVAAWDETRDEMLHVDLDSVRADPAAAATLPSAALVRALLESAERLSELESRLASQESRENAVREELARLNEEHSYTQGRLETLQEVIAALHSNLEDLRFDRQRRAALEPSVDVPALPEGDGDADPFTMGGAFR